MTPQNTWHEHNASGVLYLLDGGAKGRNAGLHLPVDFGNRGIEGIDLIEVKAQQEVVLSGYAPTQGLAQGLL